MKKFIVGFFCFLFLLTSSTVFAHHTSIDQSVSCQGYSVSADYVGGGSVRRVVTDVNFTLDSVLEHIGGDWRGISSGFNLFSRTNTGNHGVDATGTVKMYSCGGNSWDSNQKCDAQTNGNQNHNDDNGWALLSTSTFNLSFHDACQPSPTPSPSLEPSPTATPSASPNPSVSPSPSPSESPSPSPTPTPPPYVPDPPLPPQHDELPKPPAYSCQITKQVANPLVWRRGDQAIVQWQATEGSKANIYYKQVNSNEWQYSVLEVDNNGYFVINGLGGLDISFAVQQGCGPLSKTIVDGPASSWVMFR